MEPHLKSLYRSLSLNRKNNILFVEDEPSLAMIVKETLDSEGFNVTHCDNGHSALESFFSHKPDLIILDIMLPKANGYTVAKTIRNTDRQTPIIFLTAKTQVKDVINGFEAGGNDYLKKPFSMEELIVRMKVMLSESRLLNQISNEDEKTDFQIGKIHFNSTKQQLKISDQTIELTARESELLKLFCQNQNRLLSKQTILLKIWGSDSFFNSRSMDVFVSKLRKHLSIDASLKIINMRGAGYKFITE